MENPRFLPLCLILLLDSNQGVSFLGLDSARQLCQDLQLKGGQPTFSSFKVFLELLLGSKASLVPFTATMTAEATKQTVGGCMGCLASILLRRRLKPSAVSQVL